MPTSNFILTIHDPSKHAHVNEKLGAVIGSDNYRGLGAASWLIKANSGSTTQQISEQVFGPAGSEGRPSHFVGRVDAYWGFGDKNVWEWLSAT